MTPTPKKRKGGNRLRGKKVGEVRTVRTPEMRAKIIKSIVDGQAYTISDAAALAGIGRRTIYEWKETDAEFATELEKALVGPGTDILEKVALSHAVEGVIEDVWHLGKIVGHKTVFDHGLLSRMIDRRRPKALEIEAGPGLESLLTELGVLEKKEKKA